MRVPLAEMVAVRERERLAEPLRVAEPDTEPDRVTERDTEPRFVSGDTVHVGYDTRKALLLEGEAVATPVAEQQGANR